MTKKFPLLRGTLAYLTGWVKDEDGQTERRGAQLVCLCPFCGEKHYHGWDPKDHGGHIEHRVPHCEDGGPQGGYYVSVWRQTDPEYAGHVIQPGIEIIRLIEGGSQ